MIRDSVFLTPSFVRQASVATALRTTIPRLKGGTNVMADFGVCVKPEIQSLTHSDYTVPTVTIPAEVDVGMSTSFRAVGAAR
jgi:hypothetical protein